MTPGPRWAEVRFPLRCALTPATAAPGPRRFLAGLVDQQLRFRLPARRSPSWAWSYAARHGAAGAVVPLAVATARRRSRPDLDRLVSCGGQPAGSPALALDRPSAATVFVFDPDGRPASVVKRAQAGSEGVRREAAALRRAAPAGVAPRLLSDSDDDTFVQEAVAGTPWGPPELAARRPEQVDWDSAWAGLADGLARLASVTAQRSPAVDTSPVEQVLADADLDVTTRRLVTAAHHDVAALGVSVLRHGDLSGQNWLVSEGRFSGIVDWETAEHAGTPGFDVLHAAVSWFEQGVGLTRWSDGEVAAAFAVAWERSPFFDRVRAATAESLAAAGVVAAACEPVQVTFFARRLGRRLQRPEAYALGPSGAAAMLRAACGR